jgi:hypothetical protein
MRGRIRRSVEKLVPLRGSCGARAARIWFDPPRPRVCGHPEEAHLFGGRCRVPGCMCDRFWPVPEISAQVWSRLMRTRGIQHGEGTETTSEFQSPGPRRLVNSAQLLSTIRKARGGRQTRVRIRLGNRTRVARLLAREPSSAKVDPVRLGSRVAFSISSPATNLRRRLRPAAAETVCVGGPARPFRVLTRRNSPTALGVRIRC